MERGAELGRFLGLEVDPEVLEQAAFDLRLEGGLGQDTHPLADPHLERVLICWGMTIDSSGLPATPRGSRTSKG
jgi:hypothetical protein